MSAAPANTTLTALEGFAVGHWSDPVARTGCTVVLCPEGAVASGRAMGFSPATRELALLSPEKTVPGVDAVLLSGGSAFGLAAASGVTRWLEERGRGYPTAHGRVPIVAAACIYDLWVGRSDVRPDEAAGMAACQVASGEPVTEGAVGVGCGALAGLWRGPERAVRSGVGSALRSVGGARVGAVTVPNPAGNLIDPADGALVAGHATDYRDLADALTSASPGGTNTTLVVVATDALLSKAACRQLADAAHIGIARATRPSHTAGDGDTTFVIASGASGTSVPLAALGATVQEVVAEALLRGARAGASGSAA